MYGKGLVFSVPFGIPAYAGMTVGDGRVTVEGGRERWQSRLSQQPCRITFSRPFLLPPLTVIILDRTPKPILNPRRGGLDAPYAQWN